MVDSKYPDNNAGDGDLYFRSGNQPVFYFNLSNISSDANITKAVFTLYRWRDYYDGGLTGITKPIYALTNPDNTEMWDESEITYNNKKAGVPWVSSGDMSSVYGNQIGRIYFKNWMSGGQSFWTMDITDDVQSWVNNSSNNFGFTFENNANFNKGFYGKEAIDLSLRPYLEVTYTGIQDEVIPQVSDIQSKYYSGQTFISWKEATTGVNETSYKIYRYGSPITSANLKDAELIDQVYQGSSYFSDCIYYPCDFGRQPDLNKAGISLSTDSGLYVYTVENAQDSYYAVTTVVEGNENREIFENQNTISSSITETIDIPQAFVLNSEGHTGYVGYVMFLSKFNSANPSDIYGLHNKKSAPFLFSIVVPHKVTSEKGLTQYQAQTNQNVFDSYTEKFPLTFYLHTISSGSGNYFASGEGYDNSLVVGDNYGGFSIGIQDNYHLLVKTAEGQIMSIGTYLDNAHQAGYSYYSGWNSNYVPVDNINGFKSTFEEQKPFDEGVNVMYTEKSLKFLIDWLDNYSPFSQWIDENRVYFTGNSMGGGGSLFMGIRYPNDIAAINVYKGRTIILPGTDRSTAQQRVLGSLTENIPVEDGTPVYDYTNMTWYVQNHPGDYPYMRLKHGKMDTTIKWVDSEIPAFYDTISNGKIGFVAYWDQSTHQGDLDYSFVEKVNDRQFVVEMDNDGFNIFNFRLNESYISFTDFSLNENPGDGDPLTGDQIGGINRYTWFNRSTISDDSNYYEVEIYLLDEAPQDSATVTITPRRLQNLVHTSGTSYNWIFGVQSGTVTADENGLLTINGLQMSKERTKLIIGDEIVFLSPMTGMAIDENVTDEVNLSDSPNEEILDENITLEDIPSNETIGEILLNITENITDNFAAIIIIIMVLVLAIGGYVILIRMRLRVKKRRGAVRIR